MFQHKGVRYHLNDSPNSKGRIFMYALENDKFLKPLQSTSFKDAEIEVKKIIEKKL